MRVLQDGHSDSLQGVMVLDGPCIVFYLSVSKKGLWPEESFLDYRGTTRKRKETKTNKRTPTTRRKRGERPDKKVAVASGTNASVEPSEEREWNKERERMKEPSVATWCPVCDKRVSDKGGDTCTLLAHIRKSHPKRSGQYLPQEEEQVSRTTSTQGTTKSSVRAGINLKKSEPQKVYATRVDTWKSHNEQKLCPRCEKEAVPTLHARGDKLTTSHIGALCLLG
ncbi:hypothetical protein WN55_04201 [Dufourea novaeangliae]|uniref:BED-type domain-containing protein n=1 Tax=Dufourea novaeangliae TaxID=178035 RepID=A0A154PMA2_DUFNO|nr:hypothetical protein WN55_04201 [Dufourea novaeangliae]